MNGSAAGHVQLTARQLQVLEALLGGPKTATELAKVTGLSAPQVYHILKTWERRKLAERVPAFTGKGVTGFRYLWSLSDSSLTFRHPSYKATVTITFPKD